MACPRPEPRQYDAHKPGTLLKFSVTNRVKPLPTIPVRKENAQQSGAPYSSTPNLHLGTFEIGRPLGKGKSGRVYLVRHRDAGFICALKVLDKRQIMHENVEIHVQREIEVHSNLQHPGILAFHGWFHDSCQIFLILEYAAGGEHFRIPQREGYFSKSRAANKKAMHRDIKPENILVGLYGELKLADFGYSIHTPSNRRDTLCGTLDYLPPEMLVVTKHNYSSAIDKWTLESLTGEAPFEGSPVMTRRRIVKRDMKPLSASISTEAKHFIDSARCLILV